MMTKAITKYQLPDGEVTVTPGDFRDLLHGAQADILNGKRLFVSNNTDATVTVINTKP
jgi:hypothetical protein